MTAFEINRRSGSKERRVWLSARSLQDSMMLRPVRNYQ